MGALDPKSPRIATKCLLVGSRRKERGYSTVGQRQEDKHTCSDNDGHGNDATPSKARGEVDEVRGLSHAMCSKGAVRPHSRYQLHDLVEQCVYGVVDFVEELGSRRSTTNGNQPSGRTAMASCSHSDS